MKEYWDQAIDILRKNKYHVRFIKVQTTEFGLPQIRKRIILLASKKDLLNEVSLPSSTFPQTLQYTLRSLPDVNHSPILIDEHSNEFKIAKRILPYQKLCNVRGGDRSVPTWDIPEVFGTVSKREITILELIRKLRREIRLRNHGDADPVSPEDLNKRLSWSPYAAIEKLLSKKYLKSIGSRVDFTHSFNGKFRRLSFDHPTPAVDTRFGQPRYFIHPSEPRGLSVREAARIQGFPDEFIFAGNRTVQHKLVGNAVPPPLAKWIATEIREKLL